MVASLDDFISEDEIHKIIEFNLTESLYYRFAVITFAIWLAIESICAFLNSGGGGSKYGYAVAVNGLLCLINCIKALLCYKIMRKVNRYSP